MTNRFPSLRFTPWAWAKLQFLRDRGTTEVGGFGVTNPQDLLLVEDIALVRQVCSAVTVKFDDASVAEFFDRQVDAGRLPDSFGRIWIHTHPGESAFPSQVDERTFARVFARCDWSVMAILAQEGATSARLQFRAGPGGSLELPVHVDFSQPFAGSDWPAWDQEYATQVSASHASLEDWFPDPEGLDLDEGMFNLPPTRPN